MNAPNRTEWADVAVGPGKADPTRFVCLFVCLFVFVCFCLFASVAARPAAAHRRRVQAQRRSQAHRRPQGGVRACARLWDVRVRARLCGCASVHWRACVHACMRACVRVRADVRTCVQAWAPYMCGVHPPFVRCTQCCAQVLSTVEIIRSFHAEHLLPAVEAELELWTIGSTLGNAHAQHARTHARTHAHAHARKRSSCRE